MRLFKITLFIFSTFLFSQHNHGYGEKLSNASISGFVIDSEGNPLSYVSISIYSIKKDEIIDGGMSDENGLFYIDKLNPGTYSVIIESIG